MTSIAKAPNAREVKETAEIIFLMMKDQWTHHSLGTFTAWLQDEHPSVTRMGARNMWAHVLSVHGALADHELSRLWDRYGELRRTTEQRKGQAFMNALHDVSGELYLFVSDSHADPFHRDHLLLPAMELLGIDPSVSPVRAEPHAV